MTANGNTSIAVVPVEKERSSVPSIELDMEELKDICKKPVKRFWHEYAEHVVEKDGRKYIYINNDSNVLAVAHLDTVIDPKKSFNFNAYRRNGERIVKCPTLDDRLGVYIILKLLPKLLGEGCVDILLTDLEESSNTTAREFVDAHEDAEYNWMVEFDRRSSGLAHDEDAVLYSYMSGGDANEFKEALKDAGFLKIGRGSFTDIAAMQRLGVKAFNVAVGYFDNHSTSAYFKPVMTERAIANFVSFYTKYYDTKFKHEIVVHQPTTRYGTYHQSGMYYNWYDKSAEIARGFDLGGTYMVGDLVVYSSQVARGYDQTIYLVNEVILLESGQYVYDIKSFSGSYVTRNVMESSISIPIDVCYYCVRRVDETYVYYDNVGPYYLCKFCADMIHDGMRTCEECMYEFEPSDIEDANGEFGNLCEVCASDLNVIVGDVVVFNVAQDRQVPFYVKGKSRANGCIQLWDGKYTYDNKGFGYTKDIFTVVDRGVTPEQYTHDYIDIVNNWYENYNSGGAHS